MSKPLSLPSGDHGTARIPSILSTSQLSDSGILLTFADRVLIAVPCSVTTTASDDDFSIPTNTPGWNRGSHFPPLVVLAGVYRIFSPNAMIGMLSCRPCSLSSGVFPSLPMSHLFIRYAVNSTSQHNVLASGGTPVPIRCSNAAFSVLAWPATNPTARSMIPLDWLSPSGGLSGTVLLPRQCFNCWLVFAPERDPAVPELIDELRCSLCDPGELCSFSWNQHRPRHPVSPFTDDQHKRHLLFRFHLCKE